MEPRKLCVAAIQMVSKNGEVASNLNHATHLVEQAAQAGAELALLPELFSGGYQVCEIMWDTAEPQGGRTETWLRETAKRLGLYLGGSYLVARGEDFYNVFALATPAGDIAGRVPKQKPATVEAYLFRGQESSHIIETALGRVGVGICYDNHFRFLAEALIGGGADILLMPFSAPTPEQTWYFPKKRVQAYLASYRHGASNYARMLGIPAVQANKSGPWQSEFPAFFPPQESTFGGQSEIADSDGEIRAELGDEEDIIVADVLMDPVRKRRKLPEEATRWGQWISPAPWEYRMFWIFETFGRRSYARSKRRREKARAVSGGQ